ncbi:MAG: thiamine-phosphate kinase [Qipengyuania sp.]
MNEIQLLEALRSLAGHPAARGLNDDAAVLEFGGETLVLTHDMLVEGVHTLPGQDPADIAWKLVAVNLSDLAAKGAEPIGVLLGHMLGESDDRFVDGLREVLALYDIPLLGGDTVSGKGARSWGLTALGRATHKPVPSRGGAREGDGVYLVGTLGAAMMDFEAAQAGGKAGQAYCRPKPLLKEGQALAPHVTAMMDVSDGLLLDASRMARASVATLAINTAAAPLAAPESRRAEALRWGDDYALLFTASPNGTLPVPATRIGNVLPQGEHPLLIDGAPPAPGDSLGYLHR